MRPLKKVRFEPTQNTSGEINPKNRVKLFGILKKVQKLNRNNSESEDDDDDEEDEMMPQEIGAKIYVTSERVGRYAAFRTNPEEDAVQIHTYREIFCQNLETKSDLAETFKTLMVTVAYTILKTIANIFFCSFWFLTSTEFRFIHRLEDQ